MEIGGDKAIESDNNCIPHVPHKEQGKEDLLHESCCDTIREWTR